MTDKRSKTRTHRDSGGVLHKAQQCVLCLFLRALLCCCYLCMCTLVGVCL